MAGCIMCICLGVLAAGTVYMYHIKAVYLVNWILRTTLVN